MTDHDNLAQALLAWANRDDARERAAATKLLVEQGHWLHDQTFVRECVAVDGGTTFLRYWRIDELLVDNALIGSSGEMAVLRFAVALTRNMSDLSSLDRANKGLVVRALADALGVERA